MLLDTHVVLWWREASTRLSPETVELIGRADLVYVSAASAWEVAIKQALGKVRVPEPFADGVRASGFSQLPVTFQHAGLAGALPVHHTDPFDRMLVAQAHIEGLAVVTHDRRFEPYECEAVWI